MNYISFLKNSPQTVQSDLVHGAQIANPCPWAESESWSLMLPKARCSAWHRGDTRGQCAQLVKGQPFKCHSPREQALAGTPGLTSQHAHCPHCTSEDYYHKLWGQPHQGQHNPTYFGPGWLTVFVSWGRCNKGPQTGRLKTTETFSHSSESLKS